jgi:hypothetical protein
MLIGRLVRQFGTCFFIAGSVCMIVVAQGVAAQQAKVVVIRVSSLVGLVNPYFVAIDGKDVVRIGSGERSEHSVPAGEHGIAVKCFGGFLPTWNEVSVKFSIKPGEERYFLVSPSMGCAAIKPIEETDGKSRLGNARPVKPEQILGEVSAPPAVSQAPPASAAEPSTKPETELPSGPVSPSDAPPKPEQASGPLIGRYSGNIESGGASGVVMEFKGAGPDGKVTGVFNTSRERNCPIEGTLAGSTFAGRVVGSQVCTERPMTLRVDGNRLTGEIYSIVTRNMANVSLRK